MNRFPLIAFSGTSLDGGIGRNLLNLTSAFIQRGYRVDLILNDFSGPYIQQLNKKVRLFSIPTDNAITGVPWMMFYFLKYRPDVLLTPNVRLTALAIHARKLVIRKPRIYVNVHSTYGIKFQRLKQTKRAKRMKKIKRVYPDCDGILCVSNGVADDFSEYTGISRERLSVIYNPIDVEYLVKSAEDPIDHPWFDGSQIPVILSVGRLSEEKNIGLLINAFERVRDSTPVHLVIIGDGDQSSSYKQLASSSRYVEDIVFLGHQSNPWKFMANAKVFVLSSDLEGFGNVLIEAMAVGTPVVSTDCPHGPKEILQGGKYGLLVPIGNPGKLADAISETLENHLPIEVLTESIKRFELGSVAEQYLSVFGLSEK